MLSNKLTFSLTSLVILFVFGLAIVVPTAMADHDTKRFKTTLVADETTVDVSSADHIQIESGRTRESRSLATGVRIYLAITFDRAVQLKLDTTDDTVDYPEHFTLGDITVDAYDKDGRPLGVLDFGDLPETQDVVEHRSGTFAQAGQEFILQIDANALNDVYSTERGGAFEMYTLLFSIARGAVTEAGVEEVAKFRADPKHEHTLQVNERSNVLRVELVDSDEGAAGYHTITANTSTAAAAGVPGVVSITRVLGPSAFAGVADGPFEVRIILTEEPKEFTKDYIATVKGKAGDPVAGLPIAATALTTSNSGGNYVIGGDGATANSFPTPTGRDNKYHQYSVMVTPDFGLDNQDVVVSVKQFEDMVQPQSKKYIPLTDGQIKATSLASSVETQRNYRIIDGREILTVKTKTGKDDVTVAYENRQTELDAVANEIVLGNKTYIPADGYLVLVADAGKAGIQASDAKTKDKTGAELLYNTHGLGLPFPADDLDNFFRNGGTLNLGYADIPAATGSDHGDSKGPTGDDATGYTAADSTTYAKGALIFNEIMWGLNAKEKDSQYIELKNTTGAAIGIDNKEWVITVGDLPTGFTLIDTVSNIKDPTTGQYWQVPGSSGVTEASAEYPTISDLVSMARIPGSADGTAAASWAASAARQSANISGRRIGTPGAANAGVTAPAPPVVEPPPPPVMAPVATGSDIRISEIMVDSNEGRLPQWIELANVSGAEVSLSGWSVDVDNDAADADVVAESVNVTLGDVTVGKDQVVLVVTKAGRNSGMGTGADAKGMLREDRIVDVQSQVSPTDARYSLVSEMAFKIALLPPQKGGVVERGDVVGNLNMGWELPMAEGNARSSLIRREMGMTAEIMGTDAAGWVLASDTSLVGAYTNTYYGNDEDMGTPGYNAGGSLPVELSKFNAARDRLTGAVTITWETQSELNNAGFYIKRSQQKNGEFTVVNPTMIPGAGTISEKQSYSYTDTTAKPNLVYYYQIEDVSLDGQRQTLTRAHRLKGHIGAAGKATTTWGDLKSSRE